MPEVDAAVVTVSTGYTGASPPIVDTDITEIVERSSAGAPGVKTIGSQSRRGRSRTVIEFEIGRNIDEAANDALGISMALVILVILGFLRSLRSMLAPSVTIPVALVGSIALIAGFSKPRSALEKALEAELAGGSLSD